MEVTNSIRIFDRKCNRSVRAGALLRLPLSYVVVVLVMGLIWATSAVAQGVGGINTEMRYSSSLHDYGQWNAAKAWEQNYDAFKSPHEVYFNVRTAPESHLHHKHNGTVAPVGWSALGQDAGANIWQVATESVLRGMQNSDFLMDIGGGEFDANGISVYAPATFAATESVLQKMQLAGVSIDTGKGSFGNNGMIDAYSPSTFAATESVLLPMLNLAAAGGYDQTNGISDMLISEQTPFVGMLANSL